MSTINDTTPGARGARFLSTLTDTTGQNAPAALRGLCAAMFPDLHPSALTALERRASAYNGAVRAKIHAIRSETDPALIASDCQAIYDSTAEYAQRAIDALDDVIAESTTLADLPAWVSPKVSAKTGRPTAAKIAIGALCVNPSADAQSANPIARAFAAVVDDPRAFLFCADDAIKVRDRRVVGVEVHLSPGFRAAHKRAMVADGADPVRLPSSMVLRADNPRTAGMFAALAPHPTADRPLATADVSAEEITPEDIERVRRDAENAAREAGQGRAGQAQAAARAEADYRASIAADADGRKLLARQDRKAAADALDDCEKDFADAVIFAGLAIARRKRGPGSDTARTAGIADSAEPAITDEFVF